MLFSGRIFQQNSKKSTHPKIRLPLWDIQQRSHIEHEVSMKSVQIMAMPQVGTGWEVWLLTRPGSRQQPKKLNPGGAGGQSAVGACPRQPGGVLLPPQGHPPRLDGHHPVRRGRRPRRTPPSRRKGCSWVMEKRKKAVRVCPLLMRWVFRAKWGDRGMGEIGNCGIRHHATA